MMTLMRSRHFLLLGAIALSFLPLRAQDASLDKNTTFFVGRLKYSQNDGNDCGGVAEELGHLLGKASTILMGRHGANHL